MIEQLAVSTSIAGDLLERTSSTIRVQHMVQLSLAPAFLLAGIGALMNVMVNRLIWVANRIERIEARLAEGKRTPSGPELTRLERRRMLAQRAVVCSTAAALTICIVIALLFVSAFITPQIGTLVVIAWIAAMMFLVAGLLLFATETFVAVRGQQRRKQR